MTALSQYALIMQMREHAFWAMVALSGLSFVAAVADIFLDIPQVPLAALLMASASTPLAFWVCANNVARLQAAIDMRRIARGSSSDSHTFVPVQLHHAVDPYTTLHIDFSVDFPVPAHFNRGDVISVPVPNPVVLK